MPAATTPSKVNRLTSALGRATLTLGVVAAAGVAIVTATGLLADRAAAVPDQKAAQAVPVSVAPLTMTDRYNLPRRFVGQIEAGADVSLSFELGGKLTALYVDEGDAVEQGQIIARLDTDLLEVEATRLKASRAATLARLAFAQTRLTRAEQLQKQGFTSTETLDQALSERDALTNQIAEIDAALFAVEINIKKSILRSPFTGQIAARSVDRAETISAGQQVVSAMETSAPKLRVGLPLDLSAADLAQVSVDVSGTTVSATLERLRPDIDPVTRTRTAIFTLDTDNPVLFGQTAALLLQTEVLTQGAWVPTGALQSGQGSVWTVLIVTDDKLHTAAVEILHIEDDRAFVRGTFKDGTRFVTSGAHRVVAGQTVTIIGAEG
jgi:RND family efflux transporter MFP subunit